MIAVTGASGQLGHLVVEALLKTVAADQIVAVVRNVAKAEDLKAKGVQIRQADYTQSATLLAAFKGIEKLLLISSDQVGQRAPQHKAVIDAAKDAGVKLLAYTSILHADKSPLLLAEEHIATERYIAESQLPAVILRNGWYSENYTMGVASAIEHGAVAGCAGDARLATASRQDYAEAAAKVLTMENQAGKVYELAGDTAFTLNEFAQTIATVSGKPVVYSNMSEADYVALLEQVGLPAAFAAVLGNSEVGAAKGGLFDDSHQLSQLIGHATTPIADSIKAVL